MFKKIGSKGIYLLTQSGDEQRILWMKCLFYLLSMSSLILGFENWDNDIGQIHSYMEQDLANEFWHMPPEKAALFVANKFKRKEEIIKVEMKVKLLLSGYITYGGNYSISSTGNHLIRFGHQPVEYHVNFSDGHRNYSKTRYLNNNRNFTCTKKALSKQTLRACQIAQCFRGMTKTSKPGDFGIHHNSILSTPPVYYKSLQIYDLNGKRTLWQENEPEKVNGYYSHHTWVSNYAEVILRKSQEFKTTSVSKQSNDPSQREDLVQMIREILQDKNIPHEFAMTIVRGVNFTCLSELNQDIAELSKRIPPVSAYVKKLKVMRVERKDRGYVKLWNSKDQSDILYHQLNDRLSKDQTQLLRQEVDHTLECLPALGDEAKIAKLIDRKVNIDHLIYDISFKNKDAFSRLSLRKLERATSTTEHYKLISSMINIGEIEILLKYLEKVDDLKFSLYSPYTASEIRRHRPNWKLRLRKALIRYAKENQDFGYCTYSAMQQLIPEDSPRYFDLKLVGECLADPEVKNKIVNGHFEKNQHEYNQLLKKWQDLQ